MHRVVILKMSISLFNSLAHHINDSVTFFSFLIPKLLATRNGDLSLVGGLGLESTQITVLMTCELTEVKNSGLDT